jgi:hypothetical protein
MDIIPLVFLPTLVVLFIFMIRRPIHWPPLRYGVASSYFVPGGTIFWRGVNRQRAAVRVHVNEDGYMSVRTAQDNIEEGTILVEFGGEVHDRVLRRDSRPTNWFLALFGFRGQYVLDGAIRGRWTFFRYLNEAKVGSFVNSSQNISGIANHTGANAEIDWVLDVTPQRTRAILVAKYPIANNVEILWNYPWV